MPDLCYTFLLTPLYSSYLLSHWLRGNTFNPFSIISARHEVSIIYAFYRWQSLQPMQLTVVAGFAPAADLSRTLLLSPPPIIYDREKCIRNHLFRPSWKFAREQSRQSPIQFAQFNYDGWLFQSKSVSKRSSINRAGN